MKRSVVTAKGQIVIPAKLRLQPLTDEYIRSLAGIAKTWGKGDLLKTLRKFKKEEREL